MHLFSMLPLLLLILYLIPLFNKAAQRTNQRPGNPYSPSSPWAHNLETSLQKWLSSVNPAPTPETEKARPDRRGAEASRLDNPTETEGTAGIEGTTGVEGTAGSEGSAGMEGTPGTEGTFDRAVAAETEPPLSEKKPSLSNLTAENIAGAVIWSEILGKPKARINRPWPGCHNHNDK